MQVARDVAADHAAIDVLRPVELDGPKAVVIHGDAERLHQAVSSLMTNVRVHTPARTRVRIEVGRGDDTASLAVTDDGPGIPDAARERIFDRFYRADPSRSRRSGGSGFGLTIVKATVEAHGGTVAAAGTDGRSARFTITLPALDPGPESASRT
jgi:two-component system OmpR family sensor kinase